MTRFSVILPTRDRPEWLPRAVQSVLDQTFANWELVILDNSDEPYYETGPWPDRRIRYFHAKCAGVADAYNVAMRAASGEVIVQFADDDTLPQDALEVADSLLGGSQWLIGRTAIYATDGRIIAHRGGDQASVDRTLAGDYWLGGAIYFRKTLGLQVGGYPVEYDGAADFAFYVRMLRETPPVLTSEVLYQYMDWPGTDSRLRAGHQRETGDRIRSEVLNEQAA